MIVYLTFEQILRLHDSVIEKFGGLKGIRDLNLLNSSIESPQMSAFGQDLYPSIYDKASAYLFNIVRNHPFNDGNKRTGFGAAYLFLRINKTPLIPDDIECENFVVKVAEDKIKREEVASFLEGRQ